MTTTDATTPTGPRHHRLLYSAAQSMARIADRAVIADIETEGVRVGPLAERRYDIRPMLDEREHCPQDIDMASEALGYAVARGLVTFDDAAQPWLARIVAPRAA